MTEAEGLQVPVLKQDPHKVGAEQREKVLEVAIGREVKAVRKQQNITVLELSTTTGISPRTLAHIEHGPTTPPLPTLQTPPPPPPIRRPPLPPPTTGRHFSACSAMAAAGA